MDVLKYTRLLTAPIKVTGNTPGVILLLCLVTFPGYESIAQSDNAPIRTPLRDRDRSFQRTVKNWKAIRNQNIVMQQRDYTCGAAVLATMMRYYWKENVTEQKLLVQLVKMLSQNEIKDRLINGLTIVDLRKLAVENGFLATIGRLSFKELTESKIPLIVAITHNDRKHFVIFRGFDGQWVYLADPSRGNIRVPPSQFVEEWQKHTILVVIKRSGQPDPASPLHTQERDLSVSETSWQFIRALPSKTFFNPGVPLNSAR